MSVKSKHASKETMDFHEIAGIIKGLDLLEGTYALFGSAPLAAHGIRESRDIDIVALPELYEALKARPEWKEKKLQDGTSILVKGNIELYTDWRSGEYRPDVRKLIDDADTIEGMPVVRIEEVLTWKKASSREKDKMDVGLIEEYMKGERAPGTGY
jgi:hypothetical protein